jgi:DNA-binding NarL/FixJ family response regulator
MSADATPSPRLLILDDHALVGEAVVARLMSHYGSIDVVYFGASIDEAVRVATEQGADVAILDLDLGDGNSPPDNVAALSATGVPVVILSALVQAAIVRRAILAGAIGYVSKQAPLSELLQAVDTALRGEQYMSADIAKSFVAAPASSVPLSDQEQKALVLYASGLTMGSVARRMGVSEATVNEYIKRIRIKYSKAGTPVPTKVHLYQVAQSEGWLP